MFNMILTTFNFIIKALYTTLIFFWGGGGEKCIPHIRVVLSGMQQCKKKKMALCILLIYWTDIIFSSSCDSLTCSPPGHLIQ